MVATKAGLGHADPSSFTAFRIGAALICLMVVRAFWRELGMLLSPRLHGIAAILGIINVAGVLLFQNFGMSDAPVGVGSVLVYTQPFLVALGAWLIRGERLRTWQVAGIVLGWFGVAIVVSGELDAGATPARAVVLLILSGLCWAIGTLIFTMLPRGISIRDLLLLMTFYGLLPILAVYGLGILGQHEVDWGPKLVLCAIWSGLGASVFGFGLQFLLLRRGKAGVVSSWTFAVPVLAAVEGVIVLGEEAHRALLVGGAAVAAGIWLVNRDPAGDASSPSTEGRSFAPPGEPAPR